MARIGNPKSTSQSFGLILLGVFLVISITLTTVYFRESSNGPLHTVRRGVSVVTTPASSAGRWIFTPLRNFRGWTGDLFTNNKDAKKLAAENEDLRTKVMQLEESRLEAERLRKLLDVKNALELESSAARIIGTSVNNWNDAILIDKGTKEGIEVGMAVIAEGGLVGKVVEVSPYSATVQLIDDTSSGVASMIQSSRAEGIVNGGGDDTLHLNFIPKDVEVKPGDVVITSGLGGVFPKGIIIGEVLIATVDSSNVYQTIIVTPAVDPSKLEEVLVITDSSAATQGVGE